jgi:putative spermidine/putrescine transport system ATP-binding protein
MEPALRLLGIEKRFADVTALDSVTLTIEGGEFLTILGPSGSGKTTLLHVIAGYEAPDAGSVHLDGADVTLSSPARRNIGMVFQSFALFPHLTAAQNIAFPLRMRGADRRLISRRVEWVLELVSLKGLGARRPRQLSGGQQQRVALARALVFEPRLLLLDEPLGALDRKLRDAMQVELKALQRRLGVTTVLITHDQEEALALGDRVAVLREGRIEQVGTPAELYARPANRFVAEFVGESAILAATPTAVRDGEIVLDVGGLSVVSAWSGALPEHPVALLVRPEAPRPIGAGPRPRNVVRAEVLDRVYVGSSHRYRIKLPNGSELLMRCAYAPSARVLEPGEIAEVGWEPGDTHAMMA